ncbi:MAG: cytochrome c [Pseudomonadales bacterium]|jgi:mono/diheme cytochrome c family protein|nr:cytochrome c [Pseudomonadales bacterium]
MKKLSLALLLVSCVSACGDSPVTTLSTFATDSAAQAQAMGVSHGEYVARLGNCVACHSVPEGQPLAGGLKMAVPMLGNIYTTNITPDPVNGIGQYSFEEFDRVMRSGVARDGHRLYPAMPYPSYAKMSEQDMRALFDFLMNEVEPANTPNPPSEITGIKSARWPLAVWNFITVDDDPYTPDSAQSDLWNRGAYLIQGLGHCGACHTPRGLMMQEKALDGDDSGYLSGAPLDHWTASSLNGDINSGLGRWSEDDIVEFLESGHNRFGTAFGTMVEVINNSTRHMSDDDLRGMATYLKSLPAVNERSATPYAYDNGATQQLVSLDFSTPGARVYYEYCSNCHVTSGNGYYPYQPPLAGNPVVMDPDPSSLINLTLNGSLRVVAEGGPDVNDMPYFRQLLDDQDIADALTFIRSSWGNKAPAVSAAQVTEIRTATDPSRNDDIQVLRMK